MYTFVVDKIEEVEDQGGRKTGQKILTIAIYIGDGLLSMVDGELVNTPNGKMVMGEHAWERFYNDVLVAGSRVSIQGWEK